MYSAAPDEDAEAVRPMPGLRRRLPPLAELIEEGEVLALNMPAGANPALARAIGVLLKNAWMQALLRRPGRYLRPAVFICDEYQAFATVGQDDPAGDEKAFALTRQCRCIPIVATQSIRNWVVQADLDGGRRTDGLTTQEREELRRLRRENKQLRMERVSPPADTMRGAVIPPNLDPLRSDHRLLGPSGPCLLP